MTAATRIVILGGGFGGVYTAIELEKQFSATDPVEVVLISQDNFLLFTPMLHEVAASDLEPTDIVNPLHKLLRRTKIFCGSVDSISLATKKVTVSHGSSYHSHELEYDHLVIALGSVSSFHGLPGLAENALTMKSLGDALSLRNQMIAHLEEADFECCKEMRSKLLTFVVAGGGFAGVETAAAVHDFLDDVIPIYRNLSREDLRIVLVHSGKVLLPELNAKLGSYAGELLGKRGVELRFGVRVTSFDQDVLTLSDNATIEASTLVWTAGNAPNPHLDKLTCLKEKGKILVNEELQVTSFEGVWALGDCAAIPNGEKGFHPPTAQHAIREARTIAKNIRASIDKRALTPFRFTTLGQLASLGHRRGVAQVFGFCFSGFIAWWMWRTIYLAKLPRMEKRVRVALNWTLDVLFSKDTVQLPLMRSGKMRIPMTTEHSTITSDSIAKGEPPVATLIQ